MPLPPASHRHCPRRVATSSSPSSSSSSRPPVSRTESRVSSAAGASRFKLPRRPLLHAFRCVRPRVRACDLAAAGRGRHFFTPPTPTPRRSSNATARQQPRSRRSSPRTPPPPVGDSTQCALLPQPRKVTGSHYTLRAPFHRTLKERWLAYTLWQPRFPGLNFPCIFPVFLV